MSETNLSQFMIGDEDKIMTEVVNGEIYCPFLLVSSKSLINIEFIFIL